MKRNNRWAGLWGRCIGIAGVAWLLLTGGLLFCGPAFAGNRNKTLEKGTRENPYTFEELKDPKVIKEIMRKAKTWRGYKISGRVVDQYGQPVEAATVEIHEKDAPTIIQFLNAPRVLTHYVKTDKQGRFRLTVRGSQPWVADIQEFGYVLLPGESGKYPPTYVLPDHTTFWVNPHLAAGDAVFHLWKKGPRTILLKTGLYLGFHYNDRTRDFIKSVRLLPFFDWRKKRGKDPEDFRYEMRKRLEAANPFKSAEDRKLLMSLGYDLGVRAHADLEAKKWRVTLWMFRPDDGIYFTKDERLAVAPETGYKRRLEFCVPFKYQDEKGRLLPERRIEGRLFFRFFKPVLYSTCLFSVENWGGLRVGAGNYVVNPYGGRNLEPDWGVPDSVGDPLEDELRAAILAADAGKPVKLPDKAKYKKMLEDILAKDENARKRYILDNTDARYQTW